MARVLTSSKVIYLKALLFLFLGALAGALLLADQFSLQKATLLSITVWAFCRAYYFAFYVIQNYIDPEFKYAGLWHFLRTRVLKASRASE